MNDSGFILIARDMLDHPAFSQEPYCEPLAWVWLIREAAWKPRTVRLGRAVLDLDRGECVVSTRFLATRWKWSESRVRRYLKRLEKHGLIGMKTDALATRINICKYKDYQLGEEGGDAEATQHRRSSDANKKELNTLKELKKENISVTASAALDAEFDELFWPAYPKKKAKEAARRAYRTARKKASAEIISAGLKRYSSERENQNPKFTQNPATWLNGSCWLDEPETKPTTSQTDWRRDPAYAGAL